METRLTRTQLTTLRRRLEAERRQLLQLQAELSREEAALRGEAASTGMIGDYRPEDDAGMIDLEIVRGLESHDRILLEHVQEALGRIKAGTYGVCERCQDPIAVERLTAVPWTPYCIQCVTAIEREQRRHSRV